MLSQHLPPITSEPDANTLARQTVCALRGGNVTHAVTLARQFSSLHSQLAESHALLALALSACPDSDNAALHAWDEALRRNPLQPDWLAQALRLAWKAKDETFAQRWTTLQEHIFLVPPPVSLLEELEAYGWKGVGSVGIYEGRLRGWTWQPVNETPRFSVSSGGPELEIGSIQRLKTHTHALNIFSVPLPRTERLYFVRVSDASGQDAHGSPAVCSELAGATGKKKTKPDRSVAVIMPVYSDRRATLSCLSSVFASRKHCRTPFELVVVWDHGPDAALLNDLQRLAERGRLTLHVPPCNLGFLASINFALERHPRQNVLLLNADTLVHGDWLDRLHRIGSRAGTGTVTPFGSNAELLSFPSPQAPGTVTTLRDVARIDDACKQIVATDAAQVIPVGVGFCMYIPRAALDVLGGLDGHRLFRGYGEEVDFCLRAREHGLKNLAACNVFVAHLGERSFGFGKKALAAQNNLALFARYPDYDAEYQRFMRTDPLLRCRERISELLLVPLNAPLRVCSTLDAENPELLFLREQAVSTGQDWAVLMLQPCGRQTLAIVHVEQRLPLSDVLFILPRDNSRLLKILERLNPQTLLLHNNGTLVKRFAESLSYPHEVYHRVEDSTAFSVPVVSLSETKGKEWLVTPPRTLHQWSQLCGLARMHMRRGHIFRVPQLQILWGKAPHPYNIRPEFDSDGHGVSGVLLLDADLPVIHWQRWAESRKLSLWRTETFHTPNEAVCL